jgi:ABC-type antimicrobial peptide transport system permease subunit
VAELDPDLPLSRIRTLKALVRDATQGDRLVSRVMDYCMVLAIALVAIGLYGTLLYHVVQRTREIGVRMALGATPRDVLGMVLRQGFGWALAGIVVGAGAALASAKALQAMIYGVDALNPLSLLAAAAAVSLAAALACWLPARRAAQADPLEALRCE